jgi:hypothetical protein
MDPFATLKAEKNGYSSFGLCSTALPTRGEMNGCTDVEVLLPADGSGVTFGVRGRCAVGAVRGLLLV